MSSNPPHSGLMTKPHFTADTTTTTTTTTTTPTYEKAGTNSPEHESEDSLIDLLYLLLLLFLPGGGGVGYGIKKCIEKRRRRRAEYVPEARQRNEIGEIVMDVVEEAIEMCDIQGGDGGNGNENDAEEVEIDTTELGASGGGDEIHGASGGGEATESVSKCDTVPELTVDMDSKKTKPEDGNKDLLSDEQLGRLMRSKLAGPTTTKKSKAQGGARSKTEIVRKMTRKIRNYNKKKEKEGKVKEVKVEKANNLRELEEGRLRSGKNYQKKND